MPAPDRTSLEEIIAAGRTVVESAGLDGLTMQAVADRVGVRAPSLYKRVRNRGALVALVAEATVHDLAARLDSAAPSGGDARRGLVGLARELRTFAHECPVAFGLVFAPGGGGVSQGVLTAASAPVLRVATALVGESDALPAARTITAWANGFVTMELAGAFRLGGDVDRAFDYGVERLAEALANSVNEH
ncbi:TetR/AcrR family transcriptional regulator [Agromyces sp. NPDC055658]